MNMPVTDHPSRSSPTIFSILRAILDRDMVAILSYFVQLAEKHLPRFTASSLYQVLSHEVCLELLDQDGQEARYSKHQRVRFLQNNIIAYQDQAWGDGEIFIDYQCSPGIPVDRYREGHKYRILISLRETKRRGDVESFHIQRTIKAGFTQEVEEFQTEIEHPTEQASLRIVFPIQRAPKQVTLIEQTSQRTSPLGPEYIKRLADGRVEVFWSMRKPQVFERYIVRWVW